MNALTSLIREILLPGSETPRHPAGRSRRGFQEITLADLLRSPHGKRPGRPALLPVPVPARSLGLPSRPGSR